MLPTISHVPIDGAAPESASRWIAVLFGWLGAFVPGELLSIIIAIAGKYDPLIGPAINMVLLGAMLSAIVATVVCIGSVIAVFCQSRVVKRHSMRLNVTMAISGMLAAVIGLVLTRVFGEATILGIGATTIIMTAAISFTVLEVLRRTKVILPPLATLCTHCGYPIGTSAICTECGRAIHHDSRRP